MQLRVIRRLSSSELPLDELVKVEFWSRTANEPDLKPSTYQVVDASDVTHGSEVTQVLAEHAASFLSPPRIVETLRVDDLWIRVTVTQTPGTTRFTFANGRHHEYRFGDADSLMALVGLLKLVWGTDRCVAREKVELLGYIRGRLADTDTEWVSALAQVPNGSKWLKAATP